MRFLFYFGHPAHYHMFKHTIKSLKNNGHKVDILIKSKDILEELLIQEKVEFTNILSEGRKDSKIQILWGFIKRIGRISKFVSKKRPDILIGSEPSLPYVGLLFRIPSLIFVEDDAAVIPYFAKLTFPFASLVVSPVSCNLGKWTKKKISYQGFQKLPYLHPNQFKADKQKVQHLFDDRNKYFILRMSNLKAHHDFGIKGLDTALVLQIIKLLEKHGKIYISAEGILDARLLPYELKINLADIHDVLYHADMLIGDSQSMSVEAALLGTPSIRFSDFVGRIGVLDELENKYNLTFGIHTSQPELLISKVQELLLTINLKEEFNKRRSALLNDKIDTAAFFTWFIENFPQSGITMRDNPDYQLRFK